MYKLRDLTFIIVSLCCFAVYGGQTDRIIILNGYFFNELPASVKTNGISADTKIFSIETSEGIKATCLYSPSLILSEESLQYAVPEDDVKEGSELLRRYNERRNGSGVSLTVNTSGPLIKIGDKFPSFSAMDINGTTWTNADIEGKVMVLNLWFTGCGPCKREMPELSEWKDEMPDVMFFSSTYESPEIARQVLDKGIFNWIHLVNDKQFKEWIGGHGYPLTIVVDKAGEIAAF